MTTAEPFDVNATFPADPKHRAAVEALVTQAATYAGCAPDVAKDFADEVGAAFVAGVSTAAPDVPVGLKVERGSGRIEVCVSCAETVRLSRPVSES